MTRTDRRKIHYFSILTFGAISVLGVILYFRLRALTIGLIVIALLIPGRILGYFWRDQLAGLRLLNQRRFEESAQHSLRFLHSLDQRPWIRHLIWLGSGTFSRNPKSMALNNLGAAEMCLGQFEQAKRHLEEARKSDGESPLPYFNLAQLHMILDEPAIARDFLLQARRLGYSRSSSDKLFHKIQARFASTDGAKGS